MPPQFGRKLDTRDGKAYRTVLMPDGNWWLAEYVDYADNPWIPMRDDGYIDDALRAVKLYKRSTFVAIDGTRLPSCAEWDALAVVADSTTNAAPLKKLDGWNPAYSGHNGTDVYGFGLIGAISKTIAGSWSGTVGYGCDILASNGLAYTYGSAGLAGSPNTGDDMWISVRLIVESGNIPDGARIYGADFDGFERDASVRIERNIRWVDSVGGGVQGIPTMGALLDTWQISASLRVSQERGTALEAAVGPYIGQTAPTLVLPPRFGQNSFPGLVPASADDTDDTYVNPRVIEAGFTSAGRVAIVTDLFEYGLSYDLTACPTGGTANGATTPITTAPAWLAGKFARHSIRDLSNERRGVSSNGYYNVTMIGAKHGRRFDYTITLDLLTQAQADELVAYFRGVRHEAYTVYLEFGTDGFASKAAHFRELSFRRNGLHWDGSLEITLARS